jgi:branched-chain amino acid transport system ATP-binding protein
MNTQPILEIEAINTFYGETQALFDVSLTIGQGEIVSLLGASGAGKTTTIRSILGLTAPKTGRIRFDNQDITRWQTHRIARAGISWVPDDRRIFPTLTVNRNLDLGHKKTPFRSWNLKEMFNIFTALPYLMHRDCENLSGGEMQMVAITRAMLGAPGLVLFDEPTQGLAPKIVQDTMRTITQLKQEGISVLMVEQHAQLALSVSDRAYILDRGVMIYEGDAGALLKNADKRRELLGV